MNMISQSARHRLFIPHKQPTAAVSIQLQRLFFISILFVALTMGYSENTLAQASGPSCEADSRITEVFDNGASWDMCWESRIRENLVLSDIYYTAPGGNPLRVLSSARLSQLHVAYDDSDVTYNDVTQFGLGGGYLLTLSEQDCPQGELLDVQTRPALCRWRTEADTGYHTASRSNRTDSLNLFSVSQVGAYAYITSWTFYADGAIEPGIGATGALQRSSENTELPFGRQLQGDPDTLWLSHTHNYYWRLDFDLGESATDDRVVETRYVLTEEGTREQHSETFLTEQARRIEPETQRSWQINATDDENSSGYLIEPVRSGHRLERKDIEPYTDFDFFVTVANDCERFASQNARFNPDCLNHVLQYVDDQPIDNEDIVVWYRVGFHHVPRNEDQRNMHTHWDEFIMKPINVLAGTNEIFGTSNSAPVISALEDRQNVSGATIHENLTATDEDNDVLSFTATGLPPGVALDSQGHLHGTTDTAGSFPVEIEVWDDHSTTRAAFVWTVAGSDAATTSSGGRSGALSVLGALFLLLVTALRMLPAWRRI